jgi:16S rRNA C1402 N4-methylase RsmH
MRDGSVDKNRRSWNDEKDLYGNYIGPAKPFKPVDKKRKATEEETLRNPRARSAVLRVAERQETP